MTPLQLSVRNCLLLIWALSCQTIFYAQVPAVAQIVNPRTQGLESKAAMPGPVNQVRDAQKRPPGLPTANTAQPLLNSSLLNPSPQNSTLQNSTLQNSTLPASNLESANSESGLFHGARFSDACLNAVEMVDPDRHCAVGTNGTVLLTNTAGRSWRQVTTPTQAHLYGVRFLDDMRGVAVGGQIGNYTRTSLGVVLRTDDGGESWRSMPTQLPRLRGLEWDGNRLLAFGDYDPQHDTSVFQSSDSGLSWQPLPISLGHAQGLAALPPQKIAFFGRAGQNLLVDLVNQRQTPMTLPATTAGSSGVVRDLHFTGTSWIACGREGHVQVSQNGHQWKPISVDVSPEALKCCDWYSINQTGNHVWVCGQPGSFLLHSPDGGSTWRHQRTGHNLPLRKIQFLDEHRGLAVGALGSILATRDGGESWYRQRGNTAAGIVAIGSSLEEFPWAPLAGAVWETQVPAVALLQRPNPPMDSSDFLPTSTEQYLSAAQSTGIHAERSFSVPISQFAERTVVSLATWNPSIVLCEDDQSATMLSLAANPPASSNKILNELGLKPAAVEKVVATSQSSPSQFSEHSQRVLQNLGFAIWDVLSEFPPQIAARKSPCSMRTIWSRSSNLAAQSSLFGAVSSLRQRGHEAHLQSSGNYQLVMGRAHRRRTLMQHLVNKVDAESWNRDFEFILRNLPPQEVAPWLWESAHQLNNEEHGERLELILLKLAEQEHCADAATWAMIELLRYTGSEEWWTWSSLNHSKASPANPHAPQRPAISQPTPISSSNDGPSSNDGRGSNPRTPSLSNVTSTGSPWDSSPFERVPSRLSSQVAETQPQTSPSANQTQGSVVLAAATAPCKTVNRNETTRLNPLQHNHDRWHNLFGRFAQSRPQLLFRPDLMLLRHQMQHHGKPVTEGSPNHLLDRLLQSPTIARWQSVAMQELQLQAKTLNDLKLISVARSATARPQLDGRFQDLTWGNSPEMRLAPTDPQINRPATTVRWAYDEKYLYLAVSCPIPKGKTLHPLTTERSFDADLNYLDHLSIRFDTDRDYNSYIEMAVAEDGQTYDRCVGNAAYNPKWHVFVGHNPGAWVAEIAIELQAVSIRKDLANQSWAITVHRHQEGEITEAFDHFANSTMRGPQAAAGAGILYFVPAE